MTEETKKEVIERLDALSKKYYEMRLQTLNKVIELTDNEVVHNIAAGFIMAERSFIHYRAIAITEICMGPDVDRRKFALSMLDDLSGDVDEKQFVVLVGFLDALIGDKAEAAFDAIAECVDQYAELVAEAVSDAIRISAKNAERP